MHSSCAICYIKHVCGSHFIYFMASVDMFNCILDGTLQIKMPGYSLYTGNVCNKSHIDGVKIYQLKRSGHSHLGISVYGH